MSIDERDAKFKELELKMQNLESEKDAIIQEKDRRRLLFKSLVLSFAFLRLHGLMIDR